MVQLNRAQALENIDAFVKGLEGDVRDLVRTHVLIPNTPDCSAQMLRLYMTHGDRYRRVVTDPLETLRTHIGCTYDWLQLQLQKRLGSS